MNRHTSVYFISTTVLALGVLFGIASVSVAAGPHDHNHPTTGPHGGSLIELGDEEYHAELTHDHKAGTVTIYLLDSTVRRYVSVDSAELAVNVRNNRRTEQFRLKARPQKNDRNGQTSRYELTSQKLIGLLDDHHSEAQMGIKIGGRSYVGRIVHVHDHDHAHNHSHQH